MTKEKIMEELQEIFRALFDDDGIMLTNETTAEDIEDWDSLEHINLMVLIEKHYQLKFDMNEVMQLSNVGEMVKLIHTKGKLRC